MAQQTQIFPDCVGKHMFVQGQKHVTSKNRLQFGGGGFCFFFRSKLPHINKNVLASGRTSLILESPLKLTKTKLESLLCRLTCGGIKCHTITQDFTSVISLFQDCLRACQEQIERVLTSSLKQGQQYQQESAARAANKTREQQESSTPTDVRDVNLWTRNEARDCLNLWTDASGLGHEPGWSYVESPVWAVTILELFGKKKERKKRRNTVFSITHPPTPPSPPFTTSWVYFHLSYGPYVIKQAI